MSYTLPRVSAIKAALRARLLRARSWARTNEKKLKKAALTALALLALSLLLWRQAQAKIFVVNTGDIPLMLSIDGVERIVLPIVSIETPDSAIELRVNPGTHRLVTRRASPDAPDDHEIVDDLDVRFTWAASYLFAPGLTDQCFWIQHSAYGRARRNDACTSRARSGFSHLADPG
ncbi:MAG: hypothetical protein U0165_00485 [Polyangiaceae bacterium]